MQRLQCEPTLWQLPVLSAPLPAQDLLLVLLPLDAGSFPVPVLWPAAVPSPPTTPAPFSDRISHTESPDFPNNPALFSMLEPESIRTCWAVMVLDVWCSQCAGTKRGPGKMRNKAKGILAGGDLSDQWRLPGASPWDQLWWLPPEEGGLWPGPWQCWEHLVLLEGYILICGMKRLAFLPFLACCLPTMDNI